MIYDSIFAVENLPKVSYSYVFPYLNEIEKHPEIYEKKALFLDLVCTGINGSLSINDDSIVFIRNQLKKNGTLDAMEQGKLLEFILPEAQKENYIFSRLEIYPREEQRDTKYYLNRIKDRLRTKSEKYDAYIKDDNYFNPEFFSRFLKDENKTEEILEHYRKVRDKQLSNGDNPYTDKWRSYDLAHFAEVALGVGNKTVALEVIRDIAKYSVPEDIYETVSADKNKHLVKHRKIKAGEFSFLGFINNSYTEYGSMKKLIQKNGLQNEIQQIIKEYKERPDVDFYLNANPLARARKKLAQKIDYHLGTDLEHKKLPNIVKNAEQNFSDIVLGKDKGKRSY